MSDFRKIQLPNGLRIVLAPQPASLATTVMVLVSAGSLYETKATNGLSHFLEHMCFKGTTKRLNQQVIASELDSLGAEYNAFTGREYTGYFAKARREDFDKILDIVSDMYLNPVFNPAEIEKERGPIIEEINMYEDLPMRRVEELFFELVYGDQPAGWDIAGPKENILKLQREDFIKYRKNHYLANSTVVVISGGFDPIDAEEKVRSYFGDLANGAKDGKLPVKEEQAAPRFRNFEKKSDQTHLVLGFRAFGLHDPRRYALQVLADILGGGMSSRFFQKIRTELSAAYYVGAEADLYTDHGLLLMNAGIDHQKIDQVLEVAIREFSVVKNELVSNEELQRAKEHMIGNLFLSLEKSDEVAGFYGSQEILMGSLAKPEEIAAKIQAVSAEDIKKVANDIIQNDRLNFSMISPLSGKDFSSILKV